MLKKILTLIFFCSYSLPALAQSEELKLEVGASFSILHSLESDFLNSRDHKTNIGLSGRFTYHFTNNFAAEAETTFYFRNKNVEFQYPIVSVYGIRAGKAYKRIGIFAKARPGFVNYSEEVVCPAIFPGNCPSPLRSTKFAFDLGGVIEFYPSRRVTTRIDIGDSMIRNNNVTGHHLQTSIGIGWRF